MFLDFWILSDLFFNLVVELRNLHRGIVAEMVVENRTEELNLRHAFARAP